MSGSRVSGSAGSQSPRRRGRGAVAGRGASAPTGGSTASGGSAGAARRGSARRRGLQRVEETSAGGLVVDLTGRVPRGVLIGKLDRRGRLLWSLPKGHIETGETAEQAAVREVAEETGIHGSVAAVLGTIDFWFVADGRRVHKTVHHYLLHATGGELSDADIEVTEVAWVPLPDISGRLAHPDERDLIDVARELLADSA